MSAPQLARNILYSYPLRLAFLVTALCCLAIILCAKDFSKFLSNLFSSMAS